MNIATRGSFLLAIVLLTVSCTGTLRMHSQFEKTRPEIKKVAVIPPQVEYFERTATLTEPRPEMNAQFKDTLQNALTVLMKDDFEICNSGLDSLTLLENRDLALVLTKVMQQFKLKIPDIRKQKKDNLKMSLPPEVGALADASGVDYIFLTVASGYGTSGGAVARDVAINIATAVLFGGIMINQYDGLFVDMALVDANTGEILWYNYNNQDDSGYDPLSVPSTRKLCRKLMAKSLISKSATKRPRW